MSDSPTITPDVADLATAAAKAMRPAGRVRPSTWAANNVILRLDNSSKPGPFDIYWKPYTAAIHDIMYDNPGKEGCIAIKPEQIGFSRAVLNMLGAVVASDPGPILYVTTDDVKAGNFADSEFGPMWEKNPTLRPLFERGNEERRSSNTHQPFSGGVIDFVGAGSEGKLISVGRRYVILDEYQASSDNFVKTGGDLFQAGYGRLETYRANGWLYAFGHPRYPNEDIDKLYQEKSDKREWTFDCPHCGKPVELRWKNVKYTGVIKDNSGEDTTAKDPATAMLYCAKCGCGITDAQRCAGVWPACKGGTGRFESTLPPEVAAGRSFVGIAVNRLADPHLTVRSLAERDCACSTEQARQTFLNKGLGETYTRAEVVVTADNISSLVRPQTLVPGTGRAAARVLVAGSDVQGPRFNPTMYSSAVAYPADGNAYVVEMRRISGFSAYHSWLCSTGVTLSDGRSLGIRCAGIDTGYETGVVMDACRVPLYTGIGSGGLVKQLPMKFVAQLNADNPVTMAPERKREHPTRPELGLIDYYWLWRHHWVDRFIKRLMEGRIIFVCNPPKDLESHLCSNILRPLEKKHGLAREGFEWVKEHQDDWLMSLVYAEATAVMECGLDRAFAEEMARISVAGNPQRNETQQRAPVAGKGGFRIGGGGFGMGGGWGSMRT